MNAEDQREQPAKPTATGPRRIVYLVLAAVFFILGAAGALLPVLPTTPFLLLTSYFLLRTSPRLNDNILHSRFFGPILSDWQQRGGVQRHIKAKAVFIVLMVVSLTVWLTPLRSAGKWTIAGLGVIGLAVIIRLPEVSTRD